MSPAGNKYDDGRSNVEEIVAYNKILLKENRELRDENARLIRELERIRRKTKGAGNE